MFSNPVYRNKNRTKRNDLLFFPMFSFIDNACLNRQNLLEKKTSNEKYISVWFSHGVHASKIFLMRLFFSFFFSSSLLVTNTYIHPRSLHHSWFARRSLSLLAAHSTFMAMRARAEYVCWKKVVLLVRRLSPPLSLLPCFFFTFYVPYIYIYIGTLIVFFCTCIVDNIALLINIDSP